MNFNIQEIYSSTVDHFEFLPAAAGIENPISADKQESLDKVIKTISEKILAATQLQPKLSEMTGRSLSLRDVTLFYVQESDKKSGLDTPRKITEASVEDRRILQFAVHRLAESYPALTKDELSVMALSFGINEISALSSSSVATEVATEMAIAEESSIQKMEEQLNKLVTLRSKYAHTPEEQLQPQMRDFLANVDSMIANTRAQLAALTAAPEQV